MKGRKWLKRSCIGLLLFCFMCILLPAGSITSQAATQQVNGNLYSISGGNTYQLNGPTTISNQMQVNSGTVNIDLHGQTLTMRGGNACFMISPNATLNIYDSTGGGRINLSTYLIWMYNGGTVNLGSEQSGKNGPFTIDGTNENAPQMGGAIWFGSPMQGDEVVNMYAGVTIQNCKASQAGGAVYVAAPSSGHHCTFNMYGGSILNCTAPEGGGFYVGCQGTDRSTVHLEGRSKITLLGNTASRRGGAIYSDGCVEIQGILDIGHGKVSETHCDSVYIDKNNWSGYVPEYLDVTGPLVVVGDGFIDLDTNYPASNAVVQGHTVVKNSANLDPKVFYSYGSYFINSTRGLTVSAGFDPSQNNCSEAAGPSNWHTYNSDTGNFEHQTYVDVMGQTLYIEATSEPGKREYQDYNYLIYTKRSDPSTPMVEYFSVKLLKKDSESGNLLNGAKFQLTQTLDKNGDAVTGTPLATALLL